MADEVEKFVLQYEVSMKDAIARLEQLNEKVESTKKGAGNANKGFKDFATGASDEIGRLVPGIGKISTAIGIMSAGFVAAAVSVGVLAAAVKSVIAMREQYNAQRTVGMDVGVSSMRMEEYQRKMIKHGGGSVSRETTASEVAKIADMQRTAYADLSRVGVEARKFKLLGVDVGGVGKAQVPFNELLSKMGEQFAKMSPSEVQGKAKALGIEENFALALAKQGASIGKITEHTPEELSGRAAAEQSLTEFNTQLAQLEQSFNKLETSVGEKLIPAFVALLDLVDKIVNLIPKDKVTAAAENFANFAQGKEKPSRSFIENYKRHPNAVSGGGVLAAITRTFLARTTDQSGKIAPIGSAEYEREQARKKRAEQAKANAPTAPGATPVTSKVGEGAKDAKTAKSLDEMAAAADRQNVESAQSAAKMTTAINMFAGAVASFANAVDERQAWAAWAGEVGRANSLSGPQGVGRQLPGNGSSDVGKRDYTSEAERSISRPRAYSPSMADTPYDQAFSDAERKYGLPAGILKNMGRVESQFNPNAVSEVGAEGLLQIMPANKKALGITDSFDPNQNIEGAARLMAENLKATKGDLTDALKMYHAGPNRKGWGPKTEAYPVKVLAGFTEPLETRREWSGVPTPADRRGQLAIQKENKERAEVHNNLPKVMGEESYPDQRYKWLPTGNPEVDNAAPIEPNERNTRMPIANRDLQKGESRSAIQLAQVQQNIASRLGVDVLQVQHGGVNRGDVSWATDQLKAGIENQKFNITKELQAVNLPNSTRSKLLSELRAQDTGLKSLERYGPEVLDKQQEGGRSITIGERAIIINLNGVQDPEANAKEITSQLDARLQEIANGAADGIKY